MARGSILDASKNLSDANSVLSKINDLFDAEVRGAKVRADLMIAHTVPKPDAKKWRLSVLFVPIPSVCCTCVPGLLPHLPSDPPTGIRSKPDTQAWFEASAEQQWPAKRMYVCGQSIVWTLTYSALPLAESSHSARLAGLQAQLPPDLVRSERQSVDPPEVVKI